MKKREPMIMNNEGETLWRWAVVMMVILLAAILLVGCSPTYRPICGTLPNMFIDAPCYEPSLMMRFNTHLSYDDDDDQEEVMAWLQHEEMKVQLNHLEHATRQQRLYGNP